MLLRLRDFPASDASVNGGKMNVILRVRAQLEAGVIEFDVLFRRQQAFLAGIQAFLAANCPVTAKMVAVNPNSLRMGTASVNTSS